MKGYPDEGNDVKARENIDTVGKQKQNSSQIPSLQWSKAVIAIWRKSRIKVLRPRTIPSQVKFSTFSRGWFHIDNLNFIFSCVLCSISLALDRFEKGIVSDQFLFFVSKAVHGDIRFSLVSV